jgi:signal transduction histidine kinase
VTEVVTNAVQHARGDHVDLKLWLRGETLDVLVSDGGAGFIARARADDDRRTPGWGLMLVDAQALRWGSSNGPPGAVWFEVAMTRSTFR